ncbi:MAG: hypothetical protein R3B13_37235 [Polyangiaceae bacterium]
MRRIVRVVVATHGHCFDGLSSAVLFTHLYQAVRGSAEFHYRACGYGIGQNAPDERLLDGEDNAILDFRFSPSSRLSWYFDHHRTAFASDEDRAIFVERSQADPFFFDPAYSSCTKLVRDVAKERFAVESPLLTELVEWADVVDSARFSSAEQAINRSDPVKRLVSVVEHYGDDKFMNQLAPELLSRGLVDVASSESIQERYAPLGAKHEGFIQKVREKGERLGRVVFVDLTHGVLDMVAKFVTYALFPDSVYSVIVGRLRHGTKISVGYNPWCGKPLDTDISAICARHGGGGHPVVGGISFRSSEVERARSVAKDIALELAG